jgi:DNA-binding NarL/FixJ family response regulator
MAQPHASHDDCVTDAQPRTRVLIAGLDRLLCDLVTRFVNAEPDMQVVGTLRTAEDLMVAAARTNASVALLSVEDADLVAAAHRMLDDRPLLRLVALQEGGREVVVLELRPYLVRHGEMSPDGLVQAIRTASQPLPCREEWRDGR